MQRVHVTASVTIGIRCVGVLNQQQHCCKVSFARRKVPAHMSRGGVGVIARNKKTHSDNNIGIYYKIRTRTQTQRLTNR